MGKKGHLFFWLIEFKGDRFLKKKGIKGATGQLGIDQGTPFLKVRTEVIRCDRSPWRARRSLDTTDKPCALLQP